MRAEGFPAPGDFIEQQNSAGVCNLPAVCIGLWVPFKPNILGSLDHLEARKANDVLDFNAWAPLGLQPPPPSPRVRTHPV